VSVRPVRHAPDPVLARASDLLDPRDPVTVALAAALVATMRAAPGCVGVAAPQIGEPVRMFALDVTGHRRVRSCAGLVVLVNPRMVEASGQRLGREGCLSVPDLTADISRAERVVVAGREPGTGTERTVEADAFEARAFQHELDHLDGLLILDRVAGAHALHARRRYL
jgi:peptide deformylase